MQGIIEVHVHTLLIFALAEG